MPDCKVHGKLSSIIKIFLAIPLLVLLLAGCSQQVQIQQTLTAADADRISALFMQNNIGFERASSKEGMLISVDRKSFARAMALMRAAGLPRQPVENLVQIFGPKGIVSTPLEEQVRYLYGLSQELQGSLLQIDGVVTARVQVVLPDRPSPGDPLTPSSASVLIRYRPSSDVASMGPWLARLVANSIPGLAGHAADKVSILMVPVAAVPPPFATVPPHSVWQRLRWPLVLLVTVLVAGLVAAGLCKRLRAAEQGTQSSRQTLSHL